MSVSSVHMFYGKVATDMMMQRAFAKATSDCIIKFAAQYGYMFNEFDLQVSGENLQGHAVQFSDDLQQLLDQQQRLSVAVKGMGKSVGQAVGKATAGPAGAASGSDAELKEAMRLMSTIDFELMLRRFSEIGKLPGMRQKSGGG